MDRLSDFGKKLYSGVKKSLGKSLKFSKRIFLGVDEDSFLKYQSPQ